jgi:HK97 gp10 family phage protein
MEFGAEITGIEDIMRALKELSPKMERSVIVAALKEAAKPIRDQARSNVHNVSGDLKKSIKTVSVAKKFSVGGGPRVRVTAGSKSAFYSAIIEGGAKSHEIKPKNKKALKFGGSEVRSVQHPGIKAQHFMRKAFESKGAEAIKRFGESLGPKLEASLASFFKRRG